MELYDIVTLDNDRDYSVIKMEEYQGETYCMLIEVDKEENPMEELLILRKVSLNDKEFEFEELSPEMLQEVAEVFKDQFLNEEE